MDIDDPVTSVESSTMSPSQKGSVAWSDEWVAELDQMFLNIEKHMEDLRLESLQDAQDAQFVLEESSSTIANMQGGLTRCLTVLQNGRAPVPEVDDSDEDSTMTDCPDEASTNSDSASTNSPESYTTVSSFTSTSPGSHLDHATAGPGVAVVPFSGISSGEIVFKYVLKWWGPRGSCARDNRRIIEDRVTEVDGLIR